MLDNIPVYCDVNVPKYDEHGNRLLWRVKSLDEITEILIHPDNKDVLKRFLESMKIEDMKNEGL